ncbi:GlsB/YeaQ/YmgE family stress response membrane protein [Geodermatophilus sp. SYSU D00815]
MTLAGLALVLAIGFVAGLVARAVVPGKQDLGVLATLLLGLVGSVVGNLLGALLRGEQARLDVGGWWASIAGAVLVLALWVLLGPGRGRRSRRR